MSTILPSGKPNILITGGAGFIGSHLASALMKKNNHIIVVDNFITGSEKNIDLLLQNQDFEFIRHDMTEQIDFLKFPELKKFKVELQGVQEVYHLACPTSPRDYNKFPLQTLKANSHASLNALEIAKQYKAKFLFLSSSAVYGETTEQPVKEDNHGNVNPIGPRSCYNEGKRFAESLVMNYHSVYNLDTKIARVFNTFGPKMKLDDGRMIPEFILAALNNKPLIIYGTEEDSGSYCYIDDVTEAILRLINCDLNTPVNIGSNHEVHLIEVAKIIIELTGSNSKISFEPPLPYTAKQLIPDISLAKEQLDWFPIVSLEEGLQKTIEDMKVNAGEYKV